MFKNDLCPADLKVRLYQSESSKPQNPQNLRSSNPQILKSSNPQILKSSSPQILTFRVLSYRSSAGTDVLLSFVRYFSNHAIR